MLEQTFTIKNDVGLHSKVATCFISKTTNYKPSIFIEKENRRANAKSLLGVLSLGIVGGDSVTLIIEDKDEKEAAEAKKALEELGAFINNGCID